MSLHSLSRFLSTPVDTEPEPYTTAFVEALAFGVVAAVHLPDGPDPVPEHILSRLQSAERERAAELRAYRQVSFTGGRLALRLAIRQLGDRAEGVLSGPRGEPQLPRGIAGSISHKRRLAVAIAARHSHGSLGIDLEDLHPPREGIAQRILRPEELAAVEPLEAERRWTAMVVRFSLKEAFYKAVHPHLGRYVDFSEAAVHTDVDGTARIDLHLAGDDGPFVTEARYYWLPSQVLAVVRVRSARRGRRR